MISKIENIPITEKSYPFASAEKYCDLSAKGYEEKEYYMYGTANVYRSADEKGNVEVEIKDAPYVNRFIIRAPKDREKCSGNVVVEIINPSSFMEIDRMWILGHKQFIRSGDIYVGITSKPNTIAKLKEFDEKRYGKMSWANPSEKKFPFEVDDLVKKRKLIPDLDLEYETGLFWDMLTDLAWLLRSEKAQNPLREYPRDYIYLTGWSQSACYLIRYVNSFAYRDDVKRDGRVFDGYLAAGAPRAVVVPVNQYEAAKQYHFSQQRVERVSEPFIAVQTESENGRFDGFRTMRKDSDSPDFRYRLYEVTGASHDTMYSCVDYYQKDKDLERIHQLFSYHGKHKEGNDYPSWILFGAAYRNLFHWVRYGVAPNHCERIKTDAAGENCKDAFGNTIGGLRTCLLDYPTGRYNSTSNIEKGRNGLDPEAEQDGLFGYQQAFSASMLEELYGTLEHYEELVTRDTEEQVAKGFVCKEDKEIMIQIAMELAEKRGLKN